jgi:hypothetical protein
MLHLKGRPCSAPCFPLDLGVSLRLGCSLSSAAPHPLSLLTRSGGPWEKKHSCFDLAKVVHTVHGGAPGDLCLALRTVCMWHFYRENGACQARPEPRKETKSPLSTYFQTFVIWREGESGLH